MPKGAPKGGWQTRSADRLSISDGSPCAEKAVLARFDWLAVGIYLSTRNGALADDSALAKRSEAGNLAAWSRRPKELMFDLQTRPLWASPPRRRWMLLEIERMSKEIAVSGPEPLTEDEQEIFEKQEEVIKGMFAGMTNAAIAFEVIKARRLYRTEYATFADYCQLKWGKGVRSIYRLLKAAEVRDNIVTSMSHDSDGYWRGLAEGASENAMLELAKIPEQKRLPILKKVTEQEGGKPTASAIRKERKRSEHKTQPKSKPVHKLDLQRNGEHRSIDHWREWFIDGIDWAVQLYGETTEAQMKIVEHIKKVLLEGLEKEKQ